MFGFGDSLGLAQELPPQTRVPWSLGSSLLGGYLLLFLLDRAPCGGGYHDRDAAGGLLP